MMSDSRARRSGFFTDPGLEEWLDLSGCWPGYKSGRLAILRSEVRPSDPICDYQTALLRVHGFSKTENYTKRLEMTRQFCTLTDVLQGVSYSPRNSGRGICFAFKSVKMGSEAVQLERVD